MNMSKYLEQCLAHTIVIQVFKERGIRKGKQNQDGGVEGRALTPSCENTESQLTAEQSSKEDTGTYQKRCPTSKDEGEATMRR